MCALRCWKTFWLIWFREKRGFVWVDSLASWREARRARFFRFRGVARGASRWFGWNLGLWKVSFCWESAGRIGRRIDSPLIERN